jgi:signal peptidase I
MRTHGGEPLQRIKGLPERGDVVVFRSPADGAFFQIQRIIGLPGDVVEVRDGELTINAQVVKK